MTIGILLVKLVHVRAAGYALSIWFGFFIIPGTTIMGFWMHVTRARDMVWKVLIGVLAVAVTAGAMVEKRFTRMQASTIADVQSSIVLGGSAVVNGTIIYAKDNRFVLKDDTGSIELSTCPTWYKRINLHEGDHVTVVGQVMRNPSLITKSDFVMSVYRIFRGSEVIEVRGKPGKPPWKVYQPAVGGSGY